ncbi:MAG: hypothetical protein GXY83_10645 [Rhodopirellula sp.]|nr:hypothetical protein [Rhodopirellula sp.]
MEREDGVYMVLAPILAAICLFGDLNTKIGWPWVCLGQDRWIPMGYLVTCTAIGIALAMMIHSAHSGKPCCLGLVLGLLIGSALVLQWLPKAESGIQFLPLLPWRFAGWTPFLFATISWFCVGLVVLSLICFDRAVGFPVTMLLLLGVNLPLSFWSVEASPEPVAVDELDQYTAQVAEWKVQRDGMQRILDDLRRDQETLVEQLQRLGVASSADLKNVPEGRPLAEELVEIARQAQGMATEVERLNLAIIEAESKLRRIERREAMQASGLGEEEMVRTGLELTEKVRADRSGLEGLEVNEILGKMLGKGN